MKASSCFTRPGRVAFTLVEVLAALTVLALLVTILATMLSSAQRLLVATTGQIQRFQDAREAYETITRRLSQATLNTYWDYDNPNQPTAYVRQSELRFFVSNNAPALLGNTATPGHAVFFQAPLGDVTNTTNYLGLDTLLNTTGYFVQFTSDSLSRPAFLATATPSPALRYRFRLMELVEPSESFSLYQLEQAAGGNSLYTATTWFTDPLATTPPPVNIVAENVIALVVLPKLSPSDEKTGSSSGVPYTDASLAPNYSYDSTNTTVTDPSLDPKNQLPPVVQVTMVAVDETTYSRLQGTSTSAPQSLITAMTPLFQMVGDTVNPANPGYAQDLQTLEAALQAGRLDYRVFTSNVSLKGAKWSRSQSN